MSIYHHLYSCSLSEGEREREKDRRILSNVGPAGGNAKTDYVSSVVATVQKTLSLSLSLCLSLSPPLLSLSLSLSLSQLLFLSRDVIDWHWRNIHQSAEALYTRYILHVGYIFQSDNVDVSPMQAIDRESRRLLKTVAVLNFYRIKLKLYDKSWFMCTLHGLKDASKSWDKKRNMEKPRWFKSL